MITACQIYSITNLSDDERKDLIKFFVEKYQIHKEVNIETVELTGMDEDGPEFNVGTDYRDDKEWGWEFTLYGLDWADVDDFYLQKGE